MDKIKIKEEIERFKIKAEDFLENNIKAFIVDIHNEYSFCEILLVGERYLTIYNFVGSKKGLKENIHWADILTIEEYKERGDDK